MNICKKIPALGKTRLAKPLKKNGFVWLRFTFNAVEADTGVERMFFVELEFLNPLASPAETQLGYKERSAISAEDLQYALAGTQSAMDIVSERLVVPSYVAVRAGALGAGAKQICSYVPFKRTKGGWRVSKVEADGCSFCNDSIAGKVSVSSAQAATHPELLCGHGEMSWDLRFETQTSFSAGRSKKDDKWIPLGAKASFSGSVVLDGREYNVVPRKSFGLIDLTAAKSPSLPYFHISSSNLTSNITGKTLFNSCFAVHGLWGGSCALALKLEESALAVEAKDGRRKTNSICGCDRSPSNGDDEILRWSASVDTKKYVVDVDVFCASKLLFVRDIELPEGSRKVMKLLAGADGAGEIKLFRRVKKNLELVEDARIARALCEFGQADESAGES